MDKIAFLKYWAGELLAVKMELEKVAFLLNSGLKLTKEQDRYLDWLLDRKRYLEKLIEEIGKKN